MDEPDSVFDRLYIQPLKSLKVILHGFELVGECPCQSTTSPVPRSGS